MLKTGRKQPGKQCELSTRLGSQKNDAAPHKEEIYDQIGDLFMKT